MKTNPTSLLITALAAISLSSCGEKTTPSEENATTSTAPANPALEAAFVDSEPEGAISVVEARKQAQPGTTLTVTGRIAGSHDPFSADFATLILADDALRTCERIPGDSCSTPWDACCVDPKEIAAQRLTIQVVGEDGRPVGQSLKSVNGLTELDTLVVTGTVAEGSSAENLVLNATGIFAKPGSDNEENS